MASWRKRIAVTGLVAVVALGAAALWKREEIARLLAVNSLFAPEKIVANFSGMDGAFLNVPLTDGPGTPLPDGPALTLPAGVDDWIAARDVTGLVVLDGGAVVHESYHLGTGPDDLRISWSVAKSFLSLLTGILIEEGVIGLEDPVLAHVPALTGTAYDGATLEDVLQMESGVAFDENYADPDSDINQMGRVIALGGTLDDFTAGLTERRDDPGASMQYVSMDTHVVGMILRGATGRSIPDLMAEKLAEPMGLGRAYYLTDGAGAAFVLGGLNMTTRDYARMGQLIAEDGRVGDRQVVPKAWIDAATMASARTPPGYEGYGYQFWLPQDARPGEVVARGVYGQHVYVDRVRGVVIASNAADLGFNDPGVWEGNIEMFRAIAAATEAARP